MLAYASTLQDICCTCTRRRDTENLQHCLTYFFMIKAKLTSFFFIKNKSALFLSKAFKKKGRQFVLTLNGALQRLLQCKHQLKLQILMLE